MKDEPTPATTRCAIDIRVWRDRDETVLHGGFALSAPADVDGLIEILEAARPLLPMERANADV